MQLPEGATCCQNQLQLGGIHPCGALLLHWWSTSCPTFGDEEEEGIRVDRRAGAGECSGGVPGAHASAAWGPAPYPGHTSPALTA